MVGHVQCIFESERVIDDSSTMRQTIPFIGGEDEEGAWKGLGVAVMYKDFFRSSVHWDVDQVMISERKEQDCYDSTFCERGRDKRTCGGEKEVVNRSIVPYRLRSMYIYNSIEWRKSRFEPPLIIFTRLWEPGFHTETAYSSLGQPIGLYSWSLMLEEDWWKECQKIPGQGFAWLHMSLPGKVSQYMDAEILVRGNCLVACTTHVIQSWKWCFAKTQNSLMFALSNV